MSKHDLKSMTVADLDRLIAEASAQRAQTREQRRLALKSEFEAKLKAEGFTAHEVLGAKVTMAKPDKLPARYADPTDASRTWSGKGRVPGWLQVKLTAGGTLDAFRIKT